MKCVPWSLIRFKGHPNLVIIFSYINLVATSFVQEWTGSASAHLVTYSTTVIMYLAPVLFPCFGKGPIKSMAQVSKVRLGLMGGHAPHFSIMVRLFSDKHHIEQSCFCGLCLLKATTYQIEGSS